MLAICQRCAIVRSCPIHSTSHRRPALARIARVSSSKAVGKPTNCIRSMSLACLSISAFTTVSAIVGAVRLGLPSRYPTSRLRVSALTWTSSSFALPNPNQTKPNHDMTTNKATLKAEIAHAEKMLKENPTAWHGVRAGWKAQATRAKRKLEAMERGAA